MSDFSDAIAEPRWYIAHTITGYENKVKTSLEKIVANLLRQAPDAKIFFRVNTSPPKWWEDENPAELNDSGVENQPPRYCPASRKYR